MNSFDMQCTDCGNTHIIETNHELICNNCGLVLQERMYTDDPEWHSCAEGFNTKCRAEVINNSLTQSTRMIIDTIQGCTDLPDGICQNGGRMYEEHHTKCAVHKKWYTVCAFVFYAQRDLTSGARTKDEFCTAVGLDITQFSKVLGTVKDVLFQTKETQHYVRPRDNVADTLHRLVLSVPSIPQGAIQEVKRTVNRIMDKIDRSAANFASIQSQKLNAAVVYMACRFLKIKTTIKEVAESTNTSMATIIKIEAIVKTTMATKSSGMKA